MNEREETACMVCGAPMSRSVVAHPFDALPGVILEGVSRYECGVCGGVEIGIPALEALFKVLTRALVERSSPLTGRELRFLRKALGWSGVDAAAYMGVTKETISRWESGKAPISTLADRLIRMYVVQGAALRGYDLDKILHTHDERSPAPLHLRATSDEAWGAA